MVQFQNLDPFQHRVWPYLNVNETGIEDPSGTRPRPRSSAASTSSSAASASWPTAAARPS